MGISQTEYISQYLSDKMFVPTVMFWIAIAIAATSVVCFFLAPIYSKGKHGGVKVLAQIITIIDFIGGIGSILVFVAVSLLSLLTAAGAFADASLSVQENILGILLAPGRFGMSLDSFISGDLSVGTIILFYGLYFGVAGVLGIITFIVNSSARGKYNGINGKIRGAAAPQGVPQFAPYQPYGQNVQNAPQGYPQPYQQSAPQGYPQHYQQNVPQVYPQQNPQYQTTSGETTVLAPETLEPQTVPAGSMNTQSVSFVQPVAEPTEQTAHSEPATEPTDQTAPTEPVAEPQETVSTAQSVPASFCVNCGKALAQGVAFCPNCGYRVNSAPTAFCTGCGAKLPDGAAFCTTCGKKADM